MVVDDSAVVRGLETRILESDPQITVVASVGNGQLAVQALDRHDVEVAILDIEMPVLDGLSALPKLLEKDPGLKVIMASTLTVRNAEISLQALEAGAAEYLPKPTASREITAEGGFKHDLVTKVKALGQARRREKRRGGGASTFTAARARPAAPAKPAATLRPQAAPPIVLRKAPAIAEAIDVIAIGSSTGGPQALFSVLGALKAAGGVRQPILITQHMPATFTTILAGHISRAAGLEAARRQGRRGDQGRPGLCGAGRLSHGGRGAWRAKGDSPQSKPARELLSTIG